MAVRCQRYVETSQLHADRVSQTGDRPKHTADPGSNPAQVESAGKWHSSHHGSSRPLPTGCCGDGMGHRPSQPGHHQQSQRKRNATALVTDCTFMKCRSASTDICEMISARFVDEVPDRSQNAGCHSCCQHDPHKPGSGAQSPRLGLGDPDRLGSGHRCAIPAVRPRHCRMASGARGPVPVARNKTRRSPRAVPLRRWPSPVPENPRARLLHNSPKTRIQFLLELGIRKRAAARLAIPTPLRPASTDRHDRQAIQDRTVRLGCKQQVVRATW